MKTKTKMTPLSMLPHDWFSSVLA